MTDEIRSEAWAFDPSEAAQARHGYALSGRLPTLRAGRCVGSARGMAPATAAFLRLIAVLWIVGDGDPESANLTGLPDQQPNSCRGDASAAALVSHLGCMPSLIADFLRAGSLTRWMRPARRMATLP
jgi:hypothetical protein